MNREHLQKKIQDINLEVRGLIMDGGVIYDTALYGFLSMASYALMSAVGHTKEYNEEFAKIHINNSNQEQS